jgi:hypothetical protein
MKLDKNLTIGLFIFIGLMIFTSSCKNDSDSNENNTNKTATLKVVFNHKVGDQAFKMNEMIYKSKAGYPYDIRTLRYFLSEFGLYVDTSEALKIDTFHYIEATEKYKYTQTLTLSNIPEGTYDGFFFTMGLGDLFNHPIGGLDPHSLPNDVNEYLDMYWPWQEDGQYHYMKYEGFYVAGKDTLSFKLHTGPSDGNKNFFKPEKLSFSPVNLKAGDTLVLNLTMDVSKWIDGDIIYDFNKYGKGIMKNKEAQNILKSNGPKVFTLDKTELKKK